MQANEERAVEQKEMAERELARATEIKRLIAQMLSSVDPKKAQGADTTLLRGILDEASTRLRSGEISDELVESELHGILGGVYLNLSLYPEAEEHNSAAVEIKMRILGPEDHYTLNSLNNLAMVYGRQRRWDEAETMFEKTLEAKMRVLGPEHLDTLKTMRSLAVIYSGQGRLEQAETMWKETFETMKRALGPEDPNTIGVMKDLAYLYYAQGRNEKALSLQAKVLELQMKVLGPNHPSTVVTMVGVASDYVAQDQWDESASSLEKAMVKMKQVFGPEHPQTLWAMGRLAWVYFNQGRHQEAELLYEKLIEMHTRLQGPEHWKTADSMTRLADLYFDDGRYEHAARLAEKALKIQIQERPAHNLMVYSVRVVVRIYQKLDRIEEAEQLCEQWMEDLILVHGPDHARTQEVKSILADLGVARARKRAQENEWDQSAQDWIKVLERSDDSHTWLSPRKRACLELAAWPEVFQRVAKLKPDETTLWIGRGHYHALRSRWEQAASDYARGFESRSLNDESLVEYAGTLLLVGDEQGYQRLCKELGDQSVALQHGHKCFSAARTCGLGPAKDVPPSQVVDWAATRLQESTDPWVWHVMGLAQYRAGQYDEAIDNLEKSNAGDWGAQEALNWIVLAMCHHQLDHGGQARECYDQATTLMKRATPESGQAARPPAPDWIEWHVLRRQAEELLNLEDGGSESSIPLDSSWSTRPSIEFDAEHSVNPPLTHRIMIARAAITS